MPPFSPGALVRVTDPSHARFDQVGTVTAVTQIGESGGGSPIWQVSVAFETEAFSPGKLELYEG